VVGAVWDELGGLLIEQFRVPSDRPRYLDALIVQAPDRAILNPSELPDVGNGRVWAVEVKSGAVDMGVLGQALFGAELARLVMSEAEVLPIAAAPIRPPSRCSVFLMISAPAVWNGGPIRRCGGPESRSEAATSRTHPACAPKCSTGTRRAAAERSSESELAAPIGTSPALRSQGQRNPCLRSG
jgi:hypothetical protein